MTAKARKYKCKITQGCYVPMVVETWQGQPGVVKEVGKSIGYILVFASRQDAEEYAGEGANIAFGQITVMGDEKDA